MDRRDFLSSLPALAVVGSAGCSRGGADAAAGASSTGAVTTGTAASSAGPGGLTGTRLARPGVQLYTVRDAMAEAPERTLARLSEIGFREVELAGTYGRSPTDFRAMLDAAGLRAVSSHVSIMEVRERWPETLEAAVTLGQELIVVPSLPSEARSRDGLARVAEDFGRAGEAAREAGLRFGYHNHQWELQDGGGFLPIELLMDETDPEYVDWQMDVYWTVDAGADPLAWIDRYAGRVTSLHLKDRTADGEMVDVGDGVIDFGAVIAAAEGQGVLHGFIEHDAPDDPLESVRRSFEHLSPGGNP